MLHSIAHTSGGFVAPTPTDTPLGWLFNTGLTLGGLVCLIGLLAWIGTRNDRHERRQSGKLWLAILTAGAVVFALSFSGATSTAATHDKDRRASDAALIDWAEHRYELEVAPNRIARAQGESILELVLGIFGTETASGELWEPNGSRILLVEAGDGASYFMTVDTDGNPIAEISNDTAQLRGGLPESDVRDPAELSAWLAKTYGIDVDQANAEALANRGTATTMLDGQLVTFYLESAIDGNYYAFRHRDAVSGDVDTFRTAPIVELPRNAPSDDDDRG